MAGFDDELDASVFPAFDSATFEGLDDRDDFANSVLLSLEGKDRYTLLDEKSNSRRACGGSRVKVSSYRHTWTPICQKSSARRGRSGLFSVAASLYRSLTTRRPLRSRRYATVHRLIERRKRARACSMAISRASAYWHPSAPRITAVLFTVCWLKEIVIHRHAADWSPSIRIHVWGQSAGYMKPGMAELPPNLLRSRRSVATGSASPSGRFSARIRSSLSNAPDG